MRQICPSGKRRHTSSTRRRWKALKLTDTAMDTICVSLMHVKQGLILFLPKSKTPPVDTISILRMWPEDWWVLHEYLDRHRTSGHSHGQVFVFLSNPQNEWWGYSMKSYSSSNSPRWRLWVPSLGKGSLNCYIRKGTQAQLVYWVGPTPNGLLSWITLTGDVFGIRILFIYYKIKGF